jgi:hypothetical protein
MDQWRPPMATVTRSFARFRRQGVGVALCLGVLIGATQTARADAIDGDWCYTTFNLNIQGSKIRTPSGVEIQGNYTRHSFSYTTPAGEAGGGVAVAMQLMGEELMQLTRASAAPELWRRCKPVS